VHPEELTEYCKTKLAKYKVPKKIEFRKELPKSRSASPARVLWRREEEGAKRRGKVGAKAPADWSIGQ